MIISFIHGAGIGDEEHLRVGVDGQVDLNDVLVATQEVGNSLRLWLRLREGAAVDLRAGVRRGSFCCGEDNQTV